MYICACHDFCGLKGENVLTIRKFNVLGLGEILVPRCIQISGYMLVIKFLHDIVLILV